MKCGRIIINGELRRLPVDQMKPPEYCARSLKCDSVHVMMNILGWQTSVFPSIQQCHFMLRLLHCVLITIKQTIDFNRSSNMPPEKGKKVKVVYSC